MFLILATLIMIYIRIEIGKSNIPFRKMLPFHVPFSVYLGWITVATIANVSATLVSVGWNGFGIGPESWAILTLAVALAITVAVLITRKDIAYALVIIWALAGIGVKQSQNQTILSVVVIGILIVIGTSLFTIFTHWRKTKLT
ncbi:MAG: hypothetical protein QW620_05975 [Thermoplasmata archaeon]